jgi:hypothetical protein
MSTNDEKTKEINLNSETLNNNITREQVENTGQQVENTGEQLENTGEQLENTGEQLENTGKQLENTGEQLENTGKQIENTGKQIENTGKQIENIENEENKIKKRKENLTFLNYISTNYLSCIILFICLYKISNNYFAGIITFLIIFFISYFSHVFLHNYDSFFTKIHMYHHSHSNLFSHIIQLLMELSVPSILIPFYYYFDFVRNNLELWVLFFYVLFYSTVHNINYGFFKVNDVHSIHHMTCRSNFGPDLCDVVFDTKDILNNNVENTNHYILNIILITLLIIILKTGKIFSMDTIKNIVLYFNGINLTFLFIVSCVLFYNDKKDKI